MVPGVVSIQGAVPGDPDDDKIIAAAVESGASYIITEDKHLLAVREWRDIKILNRRQFETELDILEASE